MGGYTQALENQIFSGSQKLKAQLLVASQTLVSACGLYTLAKTVAGVITITLPIPAAADEGNVIVFVNAQAQANVISTAGLLLSVGVSKDTITFTAGLIGEFVRLMVVGGKYVVMDLVTTGGGTLA
jgi:hypothetical protein